MKRRDLLILSAGAGITAALSAGAQQKPMPVVGYLSSTSPGSNAPWVEAFRQGLQENGYVEGQNVAIEYRWAEGRHDRLPALAVDLLGRKIDLIAVSSIRRHWRPKRRHRASRSFLSAAEIRSSLAWSPVWLGRAGT